MTAMDDHGPAWTEPADAARRLIATGADADAAHPVFADVAARFGVRIAAAWWADVVAAMEADGRAGAAGAVGAPEAHVKRVLAVAVSDARRAVGQAEEALDVLSGRWSAGGAWNSHGARSARWWGDRLAHVSETIAAAQSALMLPPGDPHGG